MGIEDDNFNQAKEFAHNAQESQDEAAVARVANNQIQKAQLTVLKFIASIVATSAVALIPVIISDHYALADLKMSVGLIITSQKTADSKITDLQKSVFPVRSWWSFGMQTDFVKQLESQNRNLNFKTPDVKSIQESHLGDLAP